MQRGGQVGGLGAGVNDGLFGRRYTLITHEPFKTVFTFDCDLGCRAINRQGASRDWNDFLRHSCLEDRGQESLGMV